MKLRSGRTVGGSFKGLLNTLTCFSALLANEPVMNMAKDIVGQPRAYSALASFCGETCTFDNVDFFSYQAATASKSKAKKGQDPDYPSPWQALASPDADAWRDAMKQEIDVLMKLGTWTVVPRAEVEKLGHEIIKSTWALRQKRAPDGTPTKKKARFCVRGDHQNKLAAAGGLDPFESFSGCPSA